jgi:CMP-N-acetylneuraminic acid synthetase/mannose-6-phosphate isomerase-like protein (cupin superfamily)
MIPARKGSKRVHNKNLRLINGRPLIEYAIDLALKANLFDPVDIIINTDIESLAKLAHSKGVSFFSRKKEFSTDNSSNDDFMSDFMRNTQYDHYFQLLCTSPLLSSSTLVDFYHYYYKSCASTLISTYNVSIECLYKESPINFVRTKPTPRSQDITPISAYACSLMAWYKPDFLKNIQQCGAAYHGGVSSIAYFQIPASESLDIDNENDFFVAKLLLEQKHKENVLGSEKAKYWSPDAPDYKHDFHVPDILKDDLVSHLINDFTKRQSVSGTSIQSLTEIINSQDSTTSWMIKVVDTQSNSACLIHQLPGEGNRTHMHPNWDEWWYIVKGPWKYIVDDKHEYLLKTGDLISIHRGLHHRIEACGTNSEPSIRLAVSRQDVIHSYPQK